MRTSTEINEIAAALAKAQGAIEGAKKDSVNPHFRSKYADLGSVWDACRSHLSENGIAVAQSVIHYAPAVLNSPEVGPVMLMVTRLAHSSGQWIEDGGTPLILSTQDMQGLGSALTYARRYGLMAMVGIAPEDDDANAAVQKPVVETTAPAKSTKAIPTGAVLLQRTEQFKTSAGKPYWLLVLSTGEEIIEWKEQQAIFAEQACQDGLPVVITTSGGQWDGKPVVRTILRADQPVAKKEPQQELTAAEVGF